jgi:hypothetical protein
MKKIKNLILIISSIIVLFSLNSCEDAPPTDYVQNVYVEAYLYVGHSIEGIKVSYTQPVDKKYSEDIAMIKDASVKIIENNKTMDLIYKSNGKKGYYLPDTSFKVKPRTKYLLEIKLNNGKIITGETTTPSEIDWVIPPKKQFYYPKDTTKLESVDSLRIEWTAVKETPFFFVQTNCKDTLEYGKYLNPSTAEKNRRSYNPFMEMWEEQKMYRNTSNWSFLANTKTPTPWFAFKWYGLQEVRIYAPDYNMLSWFMNLYFTGSSAADPNYNSVKGAYGVFASASFCSYEVFIFKNQP